MLDITSSFFVRNIVLSGTSLPIKAPVKIHEHSTNQMTFNLALYYYKQRQDLANSADFILAIPDLKQYYKSINCFPFRIKVLNKNRAYLAD